MLVSHEFKFIYIKPKKVAGSSIQAYLARFCKNGIVYPHDPKSHMKATEVRQLIGTEIWNQYLKVTSMRNPWDKTVSLYFWRKRKRPFYVHIWRIMIGMTWHSPAWKLSFPEYVKFLHNRGELNIDRHITHVDGALPDYHIIRYEHIHDDMSTLCKKLGIEYNPEDMPQKKVGFRKEKNYRDLFDDETKELVRQAYSEEIKRFGYEF